MTLMYIKGVGAWDAVLVTLFCLITTASCLMAINCMPRMRNWYGKCALYVLALGALGIAAGPLFGMNLFPTIFDLLLHGGVAAASVWLSCGCWQELPIFNRRRARVPVAVDRRNAAEC